MFDGRWPRQRSLKWQQRGNFPWVSSVSGANGKRPASEAPRADCRSKREVSTSSRSKISTADRHVQCHHRTEFAGAYNTPSGKTLYVPLTASDPGQTITYTASTTNSSVTTTVLAGNPELVLNVSGTDSSGQAFSGTLTFAAVPDVAPQTVAAIIQDVNSGIYTASSFYRMETGTGFQLIQGGTEFDKTQPTATPATVPNEFNANAAFNSPGLLAMASSNSGGVKTAGTEFFVMAPGTSLANEPQFLNYGYAVFGQLISDPSGVYSKILNVPTTSQNGIHYANTPVTINTASIITAGTDTQNAVLAISEPAGFTGNATVTVTATGSDSSSKQQAFNVDVVPSDAGGAYVYLNPVSNLTTQAGQPITFTLTATDKANGTPTFNIGDLDPFGQTYPAMQNFTVTVTAGANNTATVTLTPKAGFTGTATLVAHADDTTNSVADAQEFTVTVTGPITVVTSGTTQEVKANNTLAVTGVSVTDPGLPITANVITTLTVTHGTLTLPTNVTNGLTAGEIQGNGSNTVTITAPLAALDATLIATNGLVYAPVSGYGGSDSIDIKSNDGSFGNTTEVTVPLAVLADLLIGVPSAATITAMNTAVVIPGGTTGLNLTDPTLPPADLVTLTFQPGHGTILLSTSVQGGITAGDVQQNGTGDVTVNATLAAINATLAATGGVTYTPGSGFNGTDTVQIQASDPVQNSATNNFSVSPA